MLNVRPWNAPGPSRTTSCSGDLHRQQPQQHLIGQREDRRVGADAERERQHDDDGEGWRLDERANGVAEILGERHERVFPTPPRCQRSSSYQPSLERDPRAAARQGRRGLEFDRKARIAAMGRQRDTRRMNAMPSDSARSSTARRGGTRCSRTTAAPTACSCTPSARPACIAVRPVPAGGRGATGSRFSIHRRPPRQAGFRACRRCHPDAATTADPWVDKIRRACVYLTNVEGHPSLATLAARLGGSPYHLQRNFKRLVGVTPREYAEACRLTTVKRRLRRGTGVTGAMLDAGYGSSSRFYERAVPKLGYGALGVSAWRCGHDDSLFRGRFDRSENCSSPRPREACVRCRWASRTRRSRRR